MTDTHAGELLLAFHLGGLEEEAASGVEAHLSRCAECLTSYFGVKRSLESAAALEERPSERVRARVRRDVAKRLAPERRAFRWMALGGAAVAAALLLSLWVKSGAKGPSGLAGVGEPAAQHETLIDNGSEVAANFF